MIPNSRAENKAVELIEEVLPRLTEVARELYHTGNERDCQRITKAINELTKVRAALE